MRGQVAHLLEGSQQFRGQPIYSATVCSELWATGPLGPLEPVLSQSTWLCVHLPGPTVDLSGALFPMRRQS